MISILMKTLLYSSPNIEFSPEEIVEYDRLISGFYKGRLIPPEPSVTKFRFLHYLASKGNFVFHGPNNPEIDMLEPWEQTLFNGRRTNAVFASSEPIWSMFYAVFDRSKLVGGFRNGCFVHKNRKYHYYSLNKTTMENDPWSPGQLYILPKNEFKPTDSGKIHFDEWVCHSIVKPINQLAVHPHDFYFKNKVSTHKHHESTVRTWLLYKYRTLKS